MTYTLIGPSLYVDRKGKLFTEREGNYEPLVNKETEAEDRYVKRHLEGGNKSEKN